MDKKYICKYCNKEFETKQKLGGHIIRCKLNPKYNEILNNWKKSFIFNTHLLNNENSLNKKQQCYCEYCGKEYKSLNSLKQHEIRCKLNPNHLEIISNFTEYNKSEEKKNNGSTNQYTKAKKLGLSKPSLSEKGIEKIKNIWKGKKLPKVMREKIQNTIQKNIENNIWHNNNGIKIKYKDNYFDSNWEVLFVKYLDFKNIKWIRPKKSFDYLWNNENHKYFPDIYLPEYDLYIEIKGIPNERDYCKWKQFDGNLDIYDSLDLFNLGIINSFDKRYIINEEYRSKHINLGEEA